MATKEELTDLLTEVVRTCNWYHDRGEVPDEDNPRVISGRLVIRIAKALKIDPLTA